MSIYGDSRDSRMEAEDTKYVIDELKKSEESLRSRTKRKVRSERDEHDSSKKVKNRLYAINLQSLFLLFETI